ncbi:MAG: hypothetical protein RL026_1456 [Pseudomonadota bacterium]
MAQVLIVEDEPAIADTLVYALQADGHAVDWQPRAEPALTRVQAGGIDLVLLDVGLPDIDGFEACRRLRRFSDVPVIFLTARSDEIDRIVGLELGADDYVVKPFSPREVAARVRAVLRRKPSRDAVAAGAAAAVVGPVLVLDADRRAARYHGQELPLTPHEYQLLSCLLAQPRRVFSREELLAALGIPRDAGYERNIDGHVKELRAKLRAVAPDAEPLRTHRGFGYSVQPDDA